jgi:hypothetical protein
MGSVVSSVVLDPLVMGNSPIAVSPLVEDELELELVGSMSVEVPVLPEPVLESPSPSTGGAPQAPALTPAAAATIPVSATEVRHLLKL